MLLGPAQIMDDVQVMKAFPPFIKALLFTSLVLTIGRGLTLPFLAIYLAEQRGLPQDNIGLILGAGLTLAIFFSLYGGYLVDRFNKRRLILSAMTVFCLSFFLLPFCSAVVELIVVVAVINCAYSLFSITLKATFAEWLSVEGRVRAFSMNYTLVNVGWAIGPPLSVMLAGHWPQTPFWLAGLLAGLMTLALARLMARYPQPAPQWDHNVAAAVTEKPNFRQTLGLLRADRRLLWFTLGGLLGSLVAGQFASCISQYLMVAFDAGFAYQVVGIILPVNAVVVICLQYLVSKKISQRSLMPWLVVGNAFFIVGLAGFMLAGFSLPIWILAVAIFSLGEIIITPVEYMFIDFIAPPHLKGSYYGMQNMSNLGGALNPMVTGLCLTLAPPNALFVLLMVATLVSVGFFFYGFRRAQPQRQAAP